MKVLITGATGLVGKGLVALCRNQGIDIHYLTTSKKKIVSEDGYQGFYWNPAQGEIDTASLDAVDVIIHLAGASIAQRWTKKNRQTILDSRIKSADVLYNAVKDIRNSTPEDHQVKHIISASAIGCYPSSHTKYYNEQYPTYAAGFLGEVIEAWEAAVTRFQKLDVATSFIRTGIILDEKEGALPKIMQPIKMYAGAPLGTGQQWQSWIHIEDMARMYLHVLKNELTGIYNGVAPNPVTNEKLTRVTAEYLKKPLLLPKVPAFALKSILGAMATIVLESQKVSADKILKTGFVFNHPTVERALEDIIT